MKEILRVVAPGGTLIVIAESYSKGKRSPLMKLLKFERLSADEQRQLFSKAGYQNVRVFEERDKGWICGIGTKAA